jgi:hypothetical protein
MSKLAVIRRKFRSYGFAGCAFKVLVRMGIRSDEAWLAERLMRRYSPYICDLVETLECPHCHGCLEKTAEGLSCHMCGDVFI